mmetsp:Transcript_21859/g.37749  ORF Transcript_21859/g.37749 Transcript_21859/m.37749 type:complete len:235 (-) Transcript_21859:1686-2390(-)
MLFLADKGAGAAATGATTTGAAAAGLETGLLPNKSLSSSSPNKSFLESEVKVLATAIGAAVLTVGTDAGAGADTAEDSSVLKDFFVGARFCFVVARLSAASTGASDVFSLVADAASAAVVSSSSSAAVGLLKRGGGAMPGIMILEASIPAIMLASPPLRRLFVTAGLLAGGTTDVGSASGVATSGMDTTTGIGAGTGAGTGVLIFSSSDSSSESSCTGGRCAGIGRATPIRTPA